MIYVLSYCLVVQTHYYEVKIVDCHIIVVGVYDSQILSVVEDSDPASDSSMTR